MTIYCEITIHFFIIFYPLVLKQTQMFESVYSVANRLLHARSLYFVGVGLFGVIWLAMRGMGN